MGNLKEVRVRIQSVSSTQQITKAMKMVSAAKLRRAQDAVVQLRPYAAKLREIMENLSASVDSADGSPYSKVRPVKKVLLVAITSNRGLCGAFNSNVIRNVNRLIHEKYAEQHKEKHVKVLCIGKKASDYFSKNKDIYVGNHNQLFNELTFDNVSKVAEAIMKEFTTESTDDIYIKTKSSGTVSKVFVSHGDNVSAGQLLAELDNQFIFQEIADVQSELDTVNSLYQEQQNLFEQNTISYDQFLATKNQKESLEAKRINLLEQLGKTKIKSPISGTVDSVEIFVGQAVAAETPAIRVVNLSRMYDSVEIIYNQFKNAAVQTLQVEQYLPVQPIKEDIQDRKLKTEDQREVSGNHLPASNHQNTDYILEPSQQEIILGLIPKSLRIQLFKALLDSVASEHGARMTSMNKATDNANEMLKQLRLSYNKARQATITNEILEIVGGAEALSKQ